MGPSVRRCRRLILIAGQTDLSQPLDPDSIQPGSFRGCHPRPLAGISPEPELTLRRRSGAYVHSINDSAGHIVARVHHSRVVRFVGRELPDLERQAELYWGESEVEACTRMWWLTIMFRPTWRR